MVHIELATELNWNISEQMYHMHSAVKTEISNMSHEEYRNVVRKNSKCQFVHAFHQLSQSDGSSKLLGFAIILRVRETFTCHKLRLDEMIVLNQTVDQAAYHVVGSSILRYIEQLAIRLKCNALTSAIDFSLHQAQPLFAEARWNAVAMFFSSSINQIVARPHNPAHTSRCAVVTSNNFYSPQSQALLVNAQSVYRHLRTEFSQLPQEIDGYLQVLYEIITQGPTFLVIAFESDSEDITLASHLSVLGLGMCRPSHNILHIDDLVTSEAHRSKGTGSFLLRQIALCVSEPNDEVIECFDVSSINTITLESGFQRLDAHRFYWTKGFISDKHYWRKSVTTSS